MTSHLIGFFVVLMVIEVVGMLPGLSTLPEEANTDEHTNNAIKDRVTIFFINMNYTTITNTFYRLKLIVKIFYPRDRT